jgi:hypothetical protein
MTTGPLPFPPAVEIGFEPLNSICAGLLWGEGSTLGDGEGSSEGSGEGLSVATEAGCRGLTTCCCALELELIVLEFSGAG